MSETGVSSQNLSTVIARPCKTLKASKGGHLHIQWAKFNVGPKCPHTPHHKEQRWATACKRGAKLTKATKPKCRAGNKFNKGPIHVCRGKCYASYTGLIYGTIKLKIGAFTFT